MIDSLIVTFLLIRQMSYLFPNTREHTSSYTVVEYDWKWFNNSNITYF